MRFFNSEYFTYRNNKLYCEDVNLSQIAQEIGTPTYVYSKKFMQDSFSNYHNAFKSVNHKIFYACKANFNINIIRLFSDLGAGVDVNSAGEFYRARKAGVSTDKLILSGVGKTRSEIKLALEHNIFLIKAESISEIEIINEIASGLKKVANIAIRVNPNVDPVTHPYISTGLAENKFGVDETLAYDIFSKANKLKNIKLIGIDMHIGSQITIIEPYVEAVSKLVNMVKNLRKRGIYLSHIDIGGGMGIIYENEKNFTPKELADSILPILSESECEIFLEPGRSLTANGGCLLSEVLYLKNNLDKNFLIIDAAMNDMLRPSLYNTFHHIQPVEISESEEFIADIVGPICESGDYLGKKREIIKPKSGDLIVIMSAGAYGMVMSSNYNARTRPPEVLVDGDTYSIIRKRETFEQIIQNEDVVLV